MSASSSLHANLALEWLGGWHRLSCSPSRLLECPPVGLLLPMSIKMNDTMPSDPMDEIATQVPAAILLDGLLQSFLLGLILSQATLYWHDYHDDSWKKRLFVVVIVTLSMWALLHFMFQRVSSRYLKYVVFRLQTILEDYKVWHVTISQKPWASHERTCI